MKHSRIFWTLPLLLFLLNLGCWDNPPPVTKPTAFSLRLNSDSRAKQAVELLLAEKNFVDFNEKELNILCWAYNQLGDCDKQLKASLRLVKLSPNGETSTFWIVNSLWNKHALSNNTTPIFDYISDAIDRGQGNARDLLTLQAVTLTVAKDRNLTDAERRTAVSDLLVRAYCAGPPSGGHFNYSDPRVFDSPDFVASELALQTYFTAQQRDALKLRMTRAKQKNDSAK